MAQDSYLIWPGGGNDPALGYGSLELRRRIAQQLAAGKRPFPKTKGEGLTYLGESIGEGMQYIGLQRAEKERQAKLEKQAKELVPDAKTDTSTSTTSDKTSYNQQDSKPFPPAASDTAYNIDRPTQVVAAPAETPAVSGLPPDLSGVPAMQTTAEWPTVPSFNDRFAAVSVPPSDATPGQAASISSPEVQNMFFSPQMQASLSGGGGATAADVMPVAQAAAPAQVTLPTETRDIPLPMGNPRTTGGVRATMEAVASRGGMTPNAIAGLERNVRDESNFNYNLRHPDQPGFSGEARFAHGLYQEGGDEWNNFVKWIDQNHPGSDWRDPKLQTQYTVERLQDPSRADYNRTFAGMNAAPNSGVAADQFLRGYLKPAEQYREARSASYLRGEGDPTYASRDVQPGGGGGAQVAGTRIAPGDERMGGAPVDQRDAIAAALMQQPQVQQQPTQEEAAAEGRLADVAGARRPGSPIFSPTAALGRAGVATDAPAAGLSPMGSLGSTGIDQSIEARRNAITDALQNQQPTAPAVPQPDPTQSGTTSPTTASPWTSAATSALPSPTVVSDITPAPVAAGQVVAQAPAIAPPALPPQSQVAPATAPYANPMPVEPKAPERLPRDDQERAAIRMKLANPGDPDAALIADTILKDKEQKRNDIFARDVERYKSQMIGYNKAMEDWRAAELNKEKRAADVAKTWGEVREQQVKLPVEYENAVLKQRLGGRDPEKFFTSLDQERDAVARQAHMLTQIKIAEEAINNGIISGFGADMRVNVAKLRDWMFKNKVEGDLASNTERMTAAAKAMLGQAVQNMQGKDPRVSEGDVRVASGMIAADPSFQLETMKKILTDNKRVAIRSIKDYEDKVDYYLSGHRTERNYQLPPIPTDTSGKYTTRLLEHQNNDEAKKEYDKYFGEGAADLEIARAKRRERRGGG